MHIELFAGDRGALGNLFALADDSATQIASYIELGDVLVARDGQSLVGHAQVVDTTEAGVAELKSLAVVERWRGGGVGRTLVHSAIAHCRSRGAHRLIVSTATADIDNLRFYQRLGFRMYRIVRDVFGTDSGYPAGIEVNGIPLRDQVFMERDCSAGS